VGCKRRRHRLMKASRRCVCLARSPPAHRRSFGPSAITQLRMLPREGRYEGVRGQVLAAPTPPSLTVCFAAAGRQKKKAYYAVPRHLRPEAALPIILLPADLC